MSKFYVTTPIYYVNDVPHIGHAYCTIAADVLARYHRANGDDVRFLTGTDEHGQKIVEAAAARNMSPKELADLNVVHFQNLWRLLNISHNDFIRTSEPRHETRVQPLVQRLLDAGDIYLGQYQGWYDVGQEEFVTETEAAANDFKSAVNKKPLVRYSEPSYFFRMSKYQQRLLDYIAANPRFIQPDSRRNEVVSKVAAGLRDLSISRATLTWGVRMPNDPAHTIYVWIDALFNYYTAVGAGEPGELAKYWPADVHLIGKDILWFHAVIWPCVLMALGIELPVKVFAHGWWTSEGEKMSKTLNNFVSPADVIARTDSKGVQVGVDRFRYFVLREVPFGQDSDFSYAQLVTRSNSELANNVGNLLSRTVNMITRYFDGQLPSPGEASEVERPIREQIDRFAGELDAAFDSLAFQRAITLALELASAANKYIDDTAPFKLAKDPSQRDRLGTILYTCAEATRIVCLALTPFMPATLERAWAQLPYAGLKAGNLSSQLSWGKLIAGSAVTRGEPLFPRIEES